MLRNRGTPKVVQGTVRHATIAITMEMHSHVLPNLQLDAVATLGALLLQNTELAKAELS